MLMLVCYNRDSYSSYKDPQETTLTSFNQLGFQRPWNDQGLYDKAHLIRCDDVRSG